MEWIGWDGSGKRFGGLFASGVGGVDDDGDVEATEVVFDERFDVWPVETADTGGEAGEGDAGELFLFGEFVEGAEGVVDVFDAGFACVAAGVGGGVLGEETDDAEASGGAPHPEGAGVWMFLMVEVAEVLVEGGPLFAESEGEAGMEVVIGGDAVGDDLSFGEENVAGDLMDHSDWLVGVDGGRIGSP